MQIGSRGPATAPNGRLQRRHARGLHRQNARYDQIFGRGAHAVGVAVGHGGPVVGRHGDSIGRREQQKVDRVRVQDVLLPRRDPSRPADDGRRSASVIAESAEFSGKALDRGNGLDRVQLGRHEVPLEQEGRGGEGLGIGGEHYQDQG